MELGSHGDVVGDRQQKGARSQGGFIFQDKCAALGVLCALNTGKLSSIAVEYATDLVLHTENGAVEYVSVKSREADQKNGQIGWSWGEIKKTHLLRDLYRHWDKGGRIGSTTVWSNAGLQGAAVALRDISENPSSITDELVAKVAKDHLFCGDEDTRNFLESFKWPRLPMPAAHVIDAALEKEARRYLTSKKLDPNRASAVAEALIGLITKRSTKDERTLPHVTAKEQHDSSEGDLRGLRYIDRGEFSEAIAAAAEQPPDSTLNRVTHLRPDALIGRSDAITSLERWWAKDFQSAAVITGPVGVGKTSVALRFAAYCQSSHLFIEDASTPEMAARVLRALRDESDMLTDDALVVVDGVIHEQALQGFLAQSTKFRILITSTRAVHRTENVHVLELDELARPEALELVHSRLTDHEGAEGLIDLLGGNPLALTQATAVCSLEQISPSEYRSRYASRIEAALDVGGTTDPLYGLGIALTPRQKLTSALAIHLELLQRRQPADLEVLRLVACCGAGALHRDRLTSWTVAVLNGKDTLSAAEMDQESRLVAPHTQGEMIGPLHRLREQSLVILQGVEVRMHNTLRMLVIASISDPLPYMQRLVGSFMSETSEGQSTFPMSLRIAREAHSVITTAEELGLAGPSLYMLAANAALFLQSQGLTKEAARMGHLALQWTERVDSDTDPIWWAIGAKLVCDWQLVSGRERQAISWLKRLASQPSLHDISAWAADRLAALATSFVYSDLLDISEKIIPKAGADLSGLSATAAAYLQLGRARLLWHSGSTPEALDLLDVAADRLRREEPEARAVSIDVVTFWAALAHDLPSGVRISRLMGVLRHIEQSFEDARGSHIYVHTLMDLADAHMDYGQTEPAAILLDQISEILQHNLPNDLQARAQLCSLQGRRWASTLDPSILQMAVKYFQQAISISDSLPPGHSPFLPATWYNLAGCLTNLQDFDGAIDAARQAARLDTERLGPDHPEVKVDVELIEWLVQLKKSLPEGGSDHGPL